jgi:hypothetical protein
MLPASLHLPASLNLPASIHLPVALIALAAGLLACFAGYRLFRFLLGVYGFIVGALVASTLVGSGHTFGLVAAGNTIAAIAAIVIGGLIGAAALTFAYFVAVALLGAGVAVLLAHAIWTGAHNSVYLAVVIGAAIVGALVAISFQRYVIVIGTAFGGAWTAIMGGLALAGDPAAAKITEANLRTSTFAHLHFAAGPSWLPIAWLALGLFGVIVQLSSGAARSKKKR